MDSIMSLSAPLKQFTYSCVTSKASPAKKTVSSGTSVRRNSFTRRKSISRRRSLPCSSQKVPDSWLRAYQAELKKERKRQQAIIAKKNAERSVRKTHFRRHHCLPKHKKGTASKKTAASAAKDDSFFGAFKGLSLDGMMGGTNTPATVAGASAAGDPCKVM